MKGRRIDGGSLISDNALFKHSEENILLQHPSTFGHGRMDSFDVQQDLLPWENGMLHLPDLGGIPPDLSLDPQLYSEPIFDAFEPMSASITTNNTGSHLHRPSVETTSPQSFSGDLLPADLKVPHDLTAGEPSLDRQYCSNAQIVGTSGETDPYLLLKYQYDEYNEASFQSVRMRKMSSGPEQDEESQSSMPTFFVIQHNALASKAQPQDKSDTEFRWRRELEDMVSEEIGKRLIQLFYKYVQPYFPILTRERGETNADGVPDIRNTHPCVLAAIYGHALPFYAWDEKLCVEVYAPPSTDRLFTIAWQSCQPLLHTPSIGLVQTLLLLVQRRPTNRHVSDTPFKWTIMSTIVSIAQSLGLNRDPTNWPIPSWEINVRKRLAWAVFVQEKWLALNFGRASHIHSDDWDIPVLTEDDFSDVDRRHEGVDPSERFSSQHFINLCALTIIVDDILRNLFSVKAVRSLHHSLEATLEVAKPLRMRLTEWSQALPLGISIGNTAGASCSPASEHQVGRRPSPHPSLELNGNASLQLAYITAKIELFRAMLRPPMTSSNSDAVRALRTGALAVAREVSEFLEGLQARELEAFWGSYGRVNFTIASGFMLLLFFTSPTIEDARLCLELIEGWRGLLRIKSRSCDLLGLALLRLEGGLGMGREGGVVFSEGARVAWEESGGGF